MPNPVVDDSVDLATNTETQSLRQFYQHKDLRMIATGCETSYRLVANSKLVSTLADLKGKQIGTIPGISTTMEDIEEDYDYPTSSTTFQIKALQSSHITPAQILVNPLKWTSDESLPYVLHLVSTKVATVAAFSSPADCFVAFSPSLLPVRTWKAHPGGIACMKSSRSNTSVLLSCGNDGLVNFFDLRNSTPSALSLKSRQSSYMIVLQDLTVKIAPYNGSRALLSLDISANDQTVAAGTEKNGEDAPILFW